MHVGLDSLNKLMERASLALARMDYLGCEQLCLEAMSLAKHQPAWPLYARVLLPLQESRRQRRITASEGVIRLGSTDLTGNPSSWLDTLIPAGCLVVTHPHDPSTAATVARHARENRRHVEVLYADNPPADRDWTLRTLAGPPTCCTVPGPPPAWVDKWLRGDTVPPTSPIEASGHPTPRLAATQPADWFLDACQALGDVVLDQVREPLGSHERVLALERCLEAVTDHEILHQRLGQAVRHLVRQAETQA